MLFLFLSIIPYDFALLSSVLVVISFLRIRKSKVA